MKYLFCLLFASLFHISFSFAAPDLKVVLNGTTYTCSEGGSSSQNLCECAVTPDNNKYYYVVLKQANQVYSSSYQGGDDSFSADPKEALLFCESRKVSLKECYGN